MSKKVRKPKNKNVNGLDLQSVLTLIVQRKPLWSPQKTVGAQFQWIQACAVSLDEALNYLKEVEPHALETHFIKQNEDLSLSAISLASDPNNSLPREWSIHILTDEHSPIAIAHSHVADFAHSSPKTPSLFSPPRALQQPLATLNAREMEILHLLAAGYSNQEIATTLVVASSTIKWYLKQIYSKLDVHSRTQAVARARQLGLLS
jgi:DNA-binding NarL/FixJ family response regulator